MARADAHPLPSEPLAEWCLAGFRWPSTSCSFPLRRARRCTETPRHRHADTQIHRHADTQR
eukprot:96466-Alexandrium_andersonii.AAC.1